MNEYTILLNDEFFTVFQTYNTDEEKVLKEFFAVNQCDIEYLCTDGNGKAYGYTWQGKYNIK